MLLNKANITKLPLWLFFLLFSLPIFSFNRLASIKQADAYFAEQQYALALTALDSVINHPKVTDHELEMSYKIQSNCFYSQKEYPKLQAVLEKIYQKFPSPKYTAKLITSYVLTKTMEKAHQLINQDLKKNPDNIYVLDEKAKIYMIDKSYIEAEKIYDEIIKKNDRDLPSEILYNIGICKMNTNKKEAWKAIAYFERAVKKSPDFLLPYVEIGKINYTDGKFKKALEALLKYAEPNSKKNYKEFSDKDFESFYLTGMSYFLSGNDNLSVRYLGKVGNWKPLAKYYRAHANRMIGRRDGNKQVFEKANRDLGAVEMKVRNPYIRYSLALVARDNGDMDAMKKYTTYLKDEYPDFEKAAYLYADYLIEQEDYSDAREHIRKLLEKKPKELYLVMKLVETDMKDEEYEDAEVTLMKAKEVFPDNIEVLNEITKVYMKLEEPEKALEAGKAALKQAKLNENALFQMASLSFEQKKFTVALDHLTTLIKKVNRKNLTAIMMRARCYFNTEKAAKGCSDLQRAEAYAKSLKKDDVLSDVAALRSANCK